MTYEEADALNAAAKAMNLGLAGMTQLRWQRLPLKERDALRDLSGLTPQLRGYEGSRVEVVTMDGTTERF